MSTPSGGKNVTAFKEMVFFCRFELDWIFLFGCSWWQIQLVIQRKRGEQSFITSPGHRKLSVATSIARWGEHDWIMFDTNVWAQYDFFSYFLFIK